MFGCYFLKINIANNEFCKQYIIILEENWCNGMHAGWEEVWLRTRKKILSQGKGTCCYYYVVILR